MADLFQKEKTKASFFFTGRFYRNPAFRDLIFQLHRDGHYLGAHSDQHLLYCDWDHRDSLLVDNATFTTDLLANYQAMASLGITAKDAPYFLPPYEWYNDTIVHWAQMLDFQIVNFTPGTRSNADYTWPELPNYRSSEAIYQSIVDYEQTHPAGLNGFILLMHIGTDDRRTDKFYYKLPALLSYLKNRGYQFVRTDELLREN